MFDPEGDLQVFVQAAVFFDRAGFGFGHKVHAPIALKHHRPIRVVSAERRGDLELAGQLPSLANARLLWVRRGELVPLA